MATWCSRCDEHAPQQRKQTLSTNGGVTGRSARHQQGSTWSTISRNWPMTSGTACMRLTSSCARSSSRFRFCCSSLMYSSCV